MGAVKPITTDVVVDETVDKFVGISGGFGIVIMDKGAEATEVPVLFCAVIITEYVVSGFKLAIT